jgi:hypothetical protein
MDRTPHLFEGAGGDRVWCGAIYKCVGALKSVQKHHVVWYHRIFFLVRVFTLGKALGRSLHPNEALISIYLR